MFHNILNNMYWDVIQWVYPTCACAPPALDENLHQAWMKSMGISK